MKRTSRNMAAVIGLSLIASLILSMTPLTEVVFAQEGTFSRPDTRYGTNGTRETTTNAEGKVVKEVWKDNSGRGLEEEDTSYGPEGEVTVTTTIYNPTPKPGGRKRARRTTRKVRRRSVINPVTNTSETYEEEIFFEEARFDKNDDKIQIGGYKREVGTNGRRTSHRWEPGKGYVEIASSVTPDTPHTIGQGGSFAARGFAVASEVAGGLNTTIFATPRGKIRVNLPDDMAAGDTLSGTVIAEPQGKNQSEIARNESELSGYVVELEKQQTSSSGRIFKAAIPTAISTTYLILKDKKGEEVARAPIPVASTTPPVEEFDLPTIGQQGRPVEVRGPFDGDSGTTQIGVGGNDLEILAESPRKVVARNPSGQPVGPSELEVKEKDQTARGEFRTLGVKLSAPKLDLVRGEQTTLTLVVSGLEGIKEEVPLEIENKSSSVIQMGGGEMQRISISPSQVRGGTYTTERPLTGVRRGAFTITGTVVSGRRQGPGSGPRGPEIAAGLPPEFTQCDCDCQDPVLKGGQNGEIICKSDSTCSRLGCDCLMFRRAKGTTDLVPEPDGAPKRAGVIPNNLLFTYLCYCVK